MLRKLFNKPTKRLLTSKKYYNKIDSIYFNACIGGGIAGGACCSYVAYKENHNKSNYITSVCETTFFSLSGFIFGFNFILLSPIILPICVIRYLDPLK